MVLNRNNEKFYRQIIMVVFFLFSLISVYTLIPWLLMLTIILTWTDGVRGALKALAQIQVRSLLSTFIAVDISRVATVKWICLFFLSFYIIIKCSSKLDKKIAQAILLLMLLLAYIIITALFVSSFPIVAIAKAISFIIPFVAILMGVSTVKDFDCIEYFTKILGFTLLSGVVLVFSSYGYLRNGHAFQGFINHPNMFGIMMAVFLAGYVHKKNGKPTFFDLFIIFAVFLLIFISESRTALFSAAIVLAVHFLSSNIKTVYKAVACILSLFFIVLALQLPIFDFLTDFIYKGNDNFFYSREDLINENLQRFYDNPFLGTGFNVPYIQGARYFTFSFNLVVENGNFATAILGDLGIIGTLIFLLCYYYIFACGNKRYSALFIVPFMISMGEMVFFSSNNCALVLYFYFAAYLSFDTKQHLDTHKSIY